MKNFRTYQMALKLFQQSRGIQFPSAEFKDQFERAILSVTLNLAEGSGRQSQKDRKRFYVMSMGSLREIQAILDLIGNEKLATEANAIGGSLYNLIRNPGAGG